MKTVLKEKPRIVEVTDPDEIDAVCRGGLNDIIGSYDVRSGQCWAYAHSLERWRKSHARETPK